MLMAVHAWLSVKPEATVLQLQLEDVKENYPYKKAKEILERFAAVSEISVIFSSVYYLFVLVILFSYISTIYWRLLSVCGIGMM